MIEYQVGDKILLKKTSPFDVPEDMRGYLGTVVTIERVERDGVGVAYYPTEVHRVWYWLPQEIAGKVVENRVIPNE